MYAYTVILLLLAVGAIATTSLATTYAETINNPRKVNIDDSDVTINLGGVNGAQGEKGDKGDAGEAGPAGPQGEQGLPGEPGPAGPEGPAGQNGSATITVVAPNGSEIVCQASGGVVDCSGTVTEPVPEPEPPVTNDTGEVPPVTNDTGEIPPVTNDTGEVPPVTNDTGEIPPVTNDTGEVPPITNDTGEIPPITNDTTDGGNGTDVNGTTTEPLCVEGEFLNLTSGQCEVSSPPPEPEEPVDNGTIPEEDGFEPE